MQTIKDNIYVLVAVAMLGIFLLVLLMIVLQVKNQNRILSQRRKIAEDEIKHQKELIRTIIVSQENERKRIGMDLHDEVGTALSALRMHIGQSTGIIDEHPLPVNIQTDSKKIIDNIIQNVRRISHNLSPFLKGAYELKDALEDIAAQLGKAGNMQAVINFNGINHFNFLAEDVQLGLFRVLSELINNTIKHAKASELHIDFLKTEPSLQIRYTDNGIGIATGADKHKGMGMMNIESRLNMIGAVYSLNAEGFNGFNMQINVPCK